jgi:hypothetical protein
MRTAASVTAVSLWIVISCGGCATGGPAGADQSVTALPATPPPAPLAAPDLLAELGRPGSTISINEWASLLSKMRSVPDRGRVDVRRRDAYLQELRRAVATWGPDVQAVVVETIDAGSGGWGVYDRVGLSYERGNDVNADAIRALGVLQVSDESTWKRIMESSKTIVDGNAPVGPELRVYDTIEAIIVHRFDGAKWTSLSLHWPLSRSQLFGQNPRTVEDLPPETAATVELIQSISSSLSGRRQPFAADWADSVAALGQLPSSSRERARTGR